MKYLIRRETKDGKELVRFMLEVFRDKKYPTKDRLEAARWLAERGFGLPESPCPSRGRKGRKRARSRRAVHPHCHRKALVLRRLRARGSTVKDWCRVCSSIVTRRQLLAIYASRYKRRSSGQSRVQFWASSRRQAAGGTWRRW
ncbi:MAG TPA: hypothetical protein VIK92_09335 [Thermaerobacter sp.]